MSSLNNSASRWVNTAASPLPWCLLTPSRAGPDLTACAHLPHAKHVHWAAFPLIGRVQAAFQTQNLSGEHCLEFDFWTLPRVCFFFFHSKPNFPWNLWSSLGAEGSAFLHRRGSTGVFFLPATCLSVTMRRQAAKPGNWSRCMWTQWGSFWSSSFTKTTSTSTMCITRWDAWACPSVVSPLIEEPGLFLQGAVCGAALGSLELFLRFRATSHMWPCMLGAWLVHGHGLCVSPRLSNKMRHFGCIKFKYIVTINFICFF